MNNFRLLRTGFFLAACLYSSFAWTQNCNANFSFTKSGCNTISFTPDLNDPTLSYTWDFGDGTSSTKATPSHNFISYGNGQMNFIVRLTVNGNDCNQESSQQTVRVDQVPDPKVLDPTGEGFLRCTPGRFEIDNGSTTKNTNTGYTIKWGNSFPDFTSNTFTSASTAYPSPGQYKLVSIVEGNNGCTSVDTFPVIISTTPNIGSEIDGMGPVCIPGDAVIKISNFENNTPNTKYTIRPNNGQPPRTYAHPPPRIVDIRLEETSCGNISVFNDSTYNHAFQVSVTAETGCPNQVTSAGVVPIRTNTIPEADFEISGEPFCENSEITFTNESTPGLFYDIVLDECVSRMGVKWSISPNNGYTITSGSLSDSIGFSATFQQAGNYTIQLIVENNFFDTPIDYDPWCEGDTITQTICILPEPESNFSVNKNSGCFPLVVDAKNTSNTLNACTPGKYTWSYALIDSECGASEAVRFTGGTTSSDQDVQLTFDSSGVYELILAVENDCGIDTFKQEIRVASSPVSRIVPIPDSCFYGPVSIQPEISTGSSGCYSTPNYSWKFDNGTPSTANGDNPPLITYNNTGEYVIELTTNNACGTQITRDTFQLFPPPTIPDITNNAPVCVGSSLRFFNNSPGNLSYSWEGPNGFTSNEAAPIIENATIEASGTYTLIVTHPVTACTASASFDVQVTNNAPITIQPNPAQVCIDGTLELTATGASNFNWKPADFLDQTTGGSVVFDPEMEGTFWVYVEGKDNIECNGVDSVEITVHPLPTVDAGEPQTVCINSTTQLTGSPIASTGASGIWSGEDVSSDGAFTPARVGSYTLTYTFTDANNCTNSDELTICVLPEPMAMFTLDQNFGCGSLSVQTNNTSNTLGSCGTVSYEWSVVSNEVDCPLGNTGMDLSSSEESPRFSFSEPGEYQITLTVTNDCSSDSFTEIVTVGQAPLITLDTLSIACGTASVMPSIKSIVSCNNEISNYEWTFEGGSPSSFIGETPPLITYNQPGDYVISLSATNSCGTSTASTTLKVLVGPNIEMQLDDFVCAGEKLQLVNNSSGERLTYNWIVPDGVSVSNKNDSVPTFTFNGPVGDYMVKVEIGNQACGLEERTFPVKVSSLPVLTLSTVDDDCAGTNLQPDFSSDIPEGFIDSLRWSILDDQGTVVYSYASADPSSFRPGDVSITAVGSYTLELIAMNGCGRTEPVSEVFRVLEAPRTVVSVDTNFLCVGESLMLANNSTGDIDLTTWSVNPSTGVDLQGENERVPQIRFDAVGDYEVKLSLSNSRCEAADTIINIRVSDIPQISLDPIPPACESTDIMPVVDYGIPDEFIDAARWVISYDDDNIILLDTIVLRPQVFPVSGPAGNYTIKVIGSNGCGETMASQSFRIDTIPEIILGPTDTICITDGLFQLPRAIPATGSWRDALGRPGVVSSDGQFDPEAAQGGVTVLEYVINIPACGDIVATKEVYVVDLSFVEGGPDLNTCISETNILLQGGFPEGGWYEGPGVNTETGSFNPSGLPEGAYTITYFYQLPGTACIQGDEFTIFVRPAPDPAINVLDSICVGTSERNAITSIQGSGVEVSAYDWLISGSSYSGEQITHQFPRIGPDTITLLATTVYGCVDSTQKEVYVSAPPEVLFEKDTSMGCAKLPVMFTNLTEGYRLSLQYQWDFGNSMTSTEEQAGTILFDQGLEDTTYYVTLRAENYCGTGQMLDSVKVLPLPIPRPFLSQDFGCSPLYVEFNNLSKGLPDAYEWVITHRGEASVYSTDSIPPPMSFTADSIVNEIYAITLTGINECGDSSITREIIVKPDSLRAFFSADITQGCEPLTVDFLNTTSPDSLLRYNWFFGEEASSNEEHTSYTFRAKNDTITDYTVTLVADNGCARDSIDVEIRVFPAPAISFTAPEVLCAQDSAQFFNTSVDVSGFMWDFGDGSPIDTSINPIHYFKEAGLYWVKLTAFSNTNGCPNTDSVQVLVRGIPQPSFSLSPLFGCPDLEVTFNNQTRDADYYKWDFGDGITTVGREPGPHIYRESGFYEIKLTAIDEYGCSNDTIFRQLQVYPEPIIDIRLVPDTICGTPVRGCVENQTLEAYKYEWDFGNGQSSEEYAPCINYETPGVYNIKYTATNEFLCANSIDTPYTVYGEPSALFSTDKAILCEGQSVVFNNLSSDAEFAEWIFSDGFRTTDWEPVRTWSVGTYGLTLIAGNGSGCTDTLSLDSSFMVHPTPVAGLLYEKLEEEFRTTYQFYDDSEGRILQYYWDFGDGQTSEEEDPVHRFLSSFDKSVLHSVENEFGCIDSVQADIPLDQLTGLFIPNVFEPDNGTQAEGNVFKPKGIGLTDYHIAVYARSGQLVWESNELDPIEGIPMGSWDGTINGRSLPPGVYVWKVHLAKFADGSNWRGMEDEKGKARKSGFVKLLR